MLGSITALRLCYKPASGTRILDLVGMKSARSLGPGETCLLFIKLHVPRMQRRSSGHTAEMDQDSLFAELESMVGTLGQEVLHVEARYKHSLIHESNTITIRHLCKIRRPKTDSRWSICPETEAGNSGSGVHARLAEYIASHCPSHEALNLIAHHLDPEAVQESAVLDIITHLQHQIVALNASPYANTCSSISIDKPSILISDTSLDSDADQPASPIARVQAFAASTPTLLTEPRTRAPSRLSTSQTFSTLPLTANITATTYEKPHAKSISTPALASTEEIADSARAIWRHIRSTSLSTLQRQLDSQPQVLEELEKDDRIVQELRRTAIGNKRSVGAETLRGWKWEGDGRYSGGQGERLAPWA